jgi:hypothetical protein
MPRDEARALEGLGRSHLDDQNRGDATELLRQALAIYQRIRAPNAAGLQQTLEGLTSETDSRRPTAPQ